MRGAIAGIAIVLIVALIIEVLTGDAHPVVVTKIAMWAGAIGYYADKAGG